MGLNLTNFSVNSQARKSYYSANASIVFNTSIFDAANGVISLYADANTTSNVVAGNYVYDVKVTDLFVGSVTRVLEGRLFVTPGVTR
jgi:hypothetical protein